MICRTATSAARGAGPSQPLHKLRAAAGEPLGYPLAEGEQVETVLRLPRFVFAPVMRGEAAGTAEYYLAGRRIGAVPLYWSESAFNAPAKPGLLRRIFGD